MLLAAALIAAAATPQDTALLDAFAAPCRHVENFGKTKAEAVASGWAEMAEDSEPRIARIEKMGRDAMEGDGGKLLGARYRRHVGGRDVFLIVSRYEDKSGYWGNGCRVYDLDAPKAIELAVAQQWIGKPPTGSQQVAGGTKHLWEPWVDGRTFELNYVPAGGEVATRFGLTGVVLVAQAIGGF